jgi:hypothetical protein
MFSACNVATAKPMTAMRSRSGRSAFAAIVRHPSVAFFNAAERFAIVGDAFSARSVAATCRVAITQAL